MSTDLSTPGSVHPGVTVVVATGIIRVVTDDLPYSVLADRSVGTNDGTPAKALAA